jgi:hypothetical protein
MVRPGRDLLTGRVEVDECYLGGLEEGTLWSQADRHQHGRPRTLHGQHLD